jgi:hypothetical protein
MAVLRVERRSIILVCDCTNARLGLGGAVTGNFERRKIEMPLRLSMVMLNPHQRCGAPGEHRHGDSESDCARAGVTVDFYIYQYSGQVLLPVELYS